MTPSDRFVRLFDVFADAGFVLYLVGGSVRDHLMGVPAGTDFDFATDARPEQTEAVLRAARFRTWNVGARFGTISTHCEGIPCEITTFRVGELYREGSRHPEVVFGNRIEDDLARRDLSVNAMAMDRDGRIVDPYDGAGAIARRELEVPGGGLHNSISILRDDPLRLLRIARFAARLDFAPTPDCTAAATATAAELVHISRERWKMELDKLLVAPHTGAGLRWLHTTGALAVVLPPLAHIEEADAIDVLADLLQSLPRHLALRWAVVALRCADAIAASTGAGPITEVRARYVVSLASELRLSGEERAALIALVALPVRPDAVGAPLGAPELRRLCAALGELAEDAIWLAWSQLPPARRSQLRGALDARLAELAALRASEDPVPRLPSGLGHALQKRYALAPGPGIRERIDRVRDAIFDGRMANAPTIEDCIAWLDTNG